LRIVDRLLTFFVAIVFVLFAVKGAAAESQKSDCSGDFSEKYIAKSGCLIGANQSDCVRLFFLAALGGGASAGALLGQFAPKFIENLKPSLKKQFMQSVADMKSQADAFANKRSGKATATETDPFVENAIYGRNQDSQISFYDLVGKNFADEYRTLKPYFDKMAKTEGKYNQFDAREALNKFLETASPKMKMAAEVIRQASIGTAQRGEAKIDAQTLLKATEETGRTGATAGATLGATFVAAAWVVPHLLDKAKLKTCQARLGLSDEDIKFLAGWTYSYVEATTGNSTDYCDEISLQDPKRVVPEALHRFGGKISAGLCKIITNDSKHLDTLVGDDRVNTASCSFFSAPNFQISSQGDKQTFTYLDNGRKISAPIDPRTMWPDLLRATVYENGSVNESATKNFQAKYGGAHMTETGETPEPPWLVDMRETCAYANTRGSGDRLKNGGIGDCTLVKAAFKARAVASVMHTACFDQAQEIPLTQPKRAVK